MLAVAPINLPMPSAAVPVTAEVQLTADAATTVAQGLAESGQRAAGAVALSPLTPTLALAGLLLGDNTLAYSATRQGIDAPLWAADPTIDALATVLPRELGGGTDGVHEADNGSDGALINFRDDVLWAATNAVRTPIAQALDVSPSLDANPQAVVGAGLLASGERVVTNTIGAPLGLLSVAEAVRNGSKEQLYIAIRQYVDGPLYAADPTIDALATVLPKPVGGTDGHHESDDGTDGQLINFRDDVLWRGTAAVRTPIADVLGVDPNLDKDDWDDYSPATITNKQLAGVNNGAKTGSATEEVVTGSGSGSANTTSPSTANRPHVVSDTVKAINNGVTQSAERLDRTVKHLAGADKKSEPKKTDAGTE